MNLTKLFKGASHATNDTIVRDLFLPDAHTPYHDKRALEALIIEKVVPAFTWDTCVVLGDWFDCYAVSDYRKSPRREHSLKKELQVGAAILSRLATVVPWKRRIFVNGNHEWRLERYLKTNAPALYDLVMKGDHFGIKAGGWENVPYMEGTHLGKINITHDLGYAGDLAVRRSLLRLQDNLVMGHVHTMDYLVRATAMGTPHVGVCFGWLGGVKHIDYKHLMKARQEWTLGFGIGYRHVRTGITWFVPVPIVKYQAVVEGRLFKA